MPRSKSGVIEKLSQYDGQLLDGKEIKSICGYSPFSNIKDTWIYKKGMIKRVTSNKRPEIYLVDMRLE